MTRAEIIAGANAQADADCRRAVEATRNADHVPEYVVSDDASGKRLLIPARAIAAGMAAYLKAAFERHQARSDAA